MSQFSREERAGVWQAFESVLTLLDAAGREPTQLEGQDLAHALAAMKRDMYNLSGTYIGAASAAVEANSPTERQVYSSETKPILKADLRRELAYIRSHGEG
jgi:hypothetical protein